MKTGKEYRVPAWCACIIANADVSGIDDDELKAWEAFEASVDGPLYLGEELGFCHSNDVDQYAGNCYQAFTLVNE